MYRRFTSDSTKVLLNITTAYTPARAAVGIHWSQHSQITIYTAYFIVRIRVFYLPIDSRVGLHTYH